MSKKMKLIISLIVLFVSLIILGFSYYIYQLSPVSNDNKMIKVEIPKGALGSRVATILKSNDLIRNVNIFKLYLKVHNINSINYGTYELNKAMSVEQIVGIISDGNTVANDIKILFKEGQNMRGIAKTIATNTNNSEEDVYSLLKDKEYIDSLIDQYWFLSDDIKNTSIYYPLEGYLAPNTYQFVNKDVTVKDIFKRMLDQMGVVLTPYKDKLKNYTIHEYLTLASVVQSEGINNEDWAKISSVFHNRLDIGWGLESCVTACYATKEDNCVSNNVDTDTNSPYNTYLSNMEGKLPVGPVSNPGVAAIEATINPADTEYFFFLSDINKKTYFSKTYPEHQAKQADLIKKGLWLGV